MTRRSGRTLQTKAVRTTWKSWWSAVWRQQRNFEWLILRYGGGSRDDLVGLDEKNWPECCTFMSWLKFDHILALLISFFAFISFVMFCGTAARFLLWCMNFHRWVIAAVDMKKGLLLLQFHTKFWTPNHHLEDTHSSRYKSIYIYTSPTKQGTFIGRFFKDCKDPGKGQEGIHQSWYVFKSPEGYTEEECTNLKGIWSWRSCVFQNWPTGMVHSFSNHWLWWAKSRSCSKNTSHSWHLGTVQRNASWNLGSTACHGWPKSTNQC